jgi:hypothetical protein
MLGLIAAARGGLTLGNPAEFTKQRPHEIEDLLGGIFGHSSVGMEYTWSITDDLPVSFPLRDWHAQGEVALSGPIVEIVKGNGKRLGRRVGFPVHKD